MGDFENGVGLVLAGGGGKGAYQIGVLKALKEQGLLEDVVAIAGTSIGAVNALLFAMDDTELMYKAWEEIDMQTVFDFDLNMVINKNFHFSRDEMSEMMAKYIDFKKVKKSKYKIYHSIAQIDGNGNPVAAEYPCLNDYDEEQNKQILLASTALPIIYEAVEINGKKYRDGGLMDNVPIKPLYDAGLRQFIIVGLSHGKTYDTSMYSDANFIAITPSRDLGDLISGTLDFTDNSIEYREMLGYKDGLRSVKTKFYPDDIYIKLEDTLANNDYNDIMMQIRAEHSYKRAEASVNANIDKFNEIAKKYDIF